MSLERSVVIIRRDAEHPAPSFTFIANARIDVGYMHLYTEGSPTLEAKWSLVQTRRSGKDGEIEETTVTEYVCPMPDSYQNFSVIDVPDVEVQTGDRFDFSVNDPECICEFVLDAYADGPLMLPEPAPEPEPEPSEEPEVA